MLEVTKTFVQVEEMKTILSKEEARKQIASLADDSITLIQDMIGDMQRKRKTKGVEHLWLVMENLNKMNNIVQDNL